MACGLCCCWACGMVRVGVMFAGGMWERGGVGLVGGLLVLGNFQVVGVETWGAELGRFYFMSDSIRWDAVCIDWCLMALRWVHLLGPNAFPADRASPAVMIYSSSHVFATSAPLGTATHCTNDVSLRCGQEWGLSCFTRRVARLELSLVLDNFLLVAGCRRKGWWSLGWLRMKILLLLRRTGQTCCLRIWIVSVSHNICCRATSSVSCSSSCRWWASTANLITRMIAVFDQHTLAHVTTRCRRVS